MKILMKTLSTYLGEKEEKSESVNERNQTNEEETYD